MKHYPCILTIAGSDCSGGAGIQADIKTISALGAYAASAITAITVQNTCGVTGIHAVPPTYIQGQIQAVMTDIPPISVKIGMLNDAGTIRAIAESLHRFTPYYNGSQAVLVKGGHLNEAEMCDVLYIKGEDRPHLFSSPKIESRNTHGTGCTLSSAIATYLALGEPLEEAVRKAKAYVYQGILSGKDVHIGEGHGPLNHFFAPVPLRVNEELRMKN